MAGVLWVLSGCVVLLFVALMGLGWAGDPDRESFFIVVLLLFVGVGAWLVRIGRRTIKCATPAPPPVPLSTSPFAPR